ncbi:MAG: hypothetical protein ACRDLS_16000 [Solirubrobacteraceae bacterium]
MRRPWWAHGRPVHAQAAIAAGARRLLRFLHAGGEGPPADVRLLARRSGQHTAYVRLQNRMIVYHGTTPDTLAGIKQGGLVPGSHVTAHKELAAEYAWMRGIELGADAAIVIELDVPDAAVIEAQSWWWAQDQLQLPAGAPASCVVSIEEIDSRPTSVG